MIIQKINAICEEAKNKFKPDLAKYGKNFRAISDSALLEELNPLFKKYNLTYAVYIRDKNLAIEKIAAGTDISGNLIEKLVFVADVHVSLDLRSSNSEDVNYDESITLEGWGMGIDSGDKATGKALTAAVKYALFKGFRLQYSDDPDAVPSEDIENIKKVSKEDKQEKTTKKKTSKKEDNEPLATDAQLNYIKGLAVTCALSDEDFKKRFGFLPYDKEVSMRKARATIDELKKLEEESLPF